MLSREREREDMVGPVAKGNPGKDRRMNLGVARGPRAGRESKGTLRLQQTL